MISTISEPEFPATPSPVPGETGDYYSWLPSATTAVVQVCFASRNRKPGHFEFYKSSLEQQTSKLLLNCQGNSWYVEGIPGFSRTYEETVDRLKTLKSYLPGKTTFGVGSSMGGYGAVLLGSEAGFDRVLGFGVEIVAGLPGGYSTEKISAAADDRFRRLDKAVEAAPGRFVLFAGEYSPPDLFGLAKIAHLPNVESLVMPDQGHAVVASFKAAEQLQSIVTLASRGESPASKFGDLDRRAFEEVLAFYPRDLEPEGLVDAAKRHFETTVVSRGKSASIELLGFFKRARHYKYVLDFYQGLGDAPDFTNEEVLSEIIYLQTKLLRYEDAIANAAKLNMMARSNVYAYFSLSYCYFKLGMIAVAIGFAQQAIVMAKQNRLKGKAILQYTRHLEMLQSIGAAKSK